MTAEIRPYRTEDLDALYHIALMTGDAGADARHLFTDPKMVGHIYAAPYAALSPGTCFVAEDGEGVCGYIVGAVDTRAYEAAAERDWWPALRPLYADPEGAPEGWSRDQTLSYLIHHPGAAARRVVAGYPSHLHINLLTRRQGQGMGRRLIDTWLETAWAMGSPGVHLGVNPANDRGKRFYAANGWERLDLGLPPHAVVFAMKRPG